MLNVISFPDCNSNPDEMDNQACPRCKTTRYRNPSLKFLVNVCGHTLCESCMELLFVKGSGACPKCSVPLRRANFRLQLFEDAMVEKEVEIRKRILRDYNKKEDDFPTLAAYNNYLEEVETIIFNLQNNIDVQETNKRIEHYKKENRDSIMRNKLRLGRGEYELEEILEKEKVEQEKRLKELYVYESDIKVRKKHEKESLIKELMYSDKNAEEIIEDFSERLVKLDDDLKNIPPPKQTTEFSTGIKFTAGTSAPYMFIPKVEEGPMFVYEPVIIDLEGPSVPKRSEIITNGFLKHLRTETIAEKAGGYEITLACQRALQEAMQGLYTKSPATTNQ